MDSCPKAIFSALQFAAVRHRAHRRKGGADVPYINHPIDVATLLATVGGVTDASILAAALLHDTVEDTPTTPEELEEHFGTEIAGLVAEVTDDPSLSSAERKVTQEAEAPGKSPSAKLIRLADKTCNVRDVGASPPLHHGATPDGCQSLPVEPPLVSARRTHRVRREIAILLPCADETCHIAWYPWGLGRRTTRTSARR